jgi:methyl-accepting chemotaxis protein
VIVSITIAVLILPLFAVANQASAQIAAQTATVERAHAYGDLLGVRYMDEIRSARDLAAIPRARPRALGQAAAGWVDVVLIVVVILIGGAVFQVMYQRRRVKAATAAIEEQRTERLTEDILNVSQALTLAREGDLTVEVPAAESEVGLIALMVNGLLADYSQMVAGIIRASRAVQQGALRVDDGVRTIVDSAAQQSTEMTTMAGTVEALAASAAAVQEATRRATELASDASRSVEQGQEAVGRIGESVDSIKEAAIGTTREFKRLQEDSIRLTALVSSVKSNAENLDMQAANAALEARHLGTETGSAFATNIGRLARQAQETLADAETAVRSVIASIDAVNRRIERISEQVRLGVDEVRAVRANFEDITTTNQASVQFIEQVAGSAHAQATNAQRVAASIIAMATTFRQFNEMLVASGDEMAHMRLIVANLQESVSTLKVDGTLLAEVSDEGDAPSVESAA